MKYHLGTDLGIVGEDSLNHLDFEYHMSEKSLDWVKYQNLIYKLYQTLYIKKLY